MSTYGLNAWDVKIAAERAYVNVWDVRITEGEHFGKIMTIYGREGTDALLVSETQEFLQVPLKHLRAIEGTARSYRRVPALA